MPAMRVEVPAGTPAGARQTVRIAVVGTLRSVGPAGE